MFPARAQTWIARSGGKHINHEATTVFIQFEIFRSKQKLKQGEYTYQIFVNKPKQLSIHNKACEVLDVTQQIIKLQIKRKY